MSRPLRVLDLFSGIGGFSLGLERAGMQTVAFCEIDPFCGGPARVIGNETQFVICDDCEIIGPKGEQAIAAWNARPGEDEAVREAEDRGYKRAVKMVAALVADALIYSDGYGVYGSDFLCCMGCNAGGAPGVPFEHSKDCVVLKCETIADDFWQEQRDELNAVNDENDRLRAELAALRTHGSQP